MQVTSAKSRRLTSLNYRQRLMARMIAQDNRHDINMDVDAVLDFINSEAMHLSKKHKRSVPWFKHQFYQGGRMVRRKRAVGMVNAARQIDGFIEGCKGCKSYKYVHSFAGFICFTAITEEEKKQFIDIKAKIGQLDGGVLHASALPQDMQQFLKDKTQAWRTEKHTAP